MLPSSSSLLQPTPKRAGRAKRARDSEGDTQAHVSCADTADTRLQRWLLRPSSSAALELLTKQLGLGGKARATASTARVAAPASRAGAGAGGGDLSTTEETRLTYLHLGDDAQRRELQEVLAERRDSTSPGESAADLSVAVRWTPGDGGGELAVVLHRATRGAAAALRRIGSLPPSLAATLRRSVKEGRVTVRGVLHAGGAEKAAAATAHAARPAAGHVSKCEPSVYALTLWMSSQHAETAPLNDSCARRRASLASMAAPGAQGTATRALLRWAIRRQQL